MTIAFTPEYVEEFISSSPKKNGCYNLFFVLNDKIGLKLSQTPEARDSNYQRQEKAAQIDLGPDVYGKIDVLYQGEKFYGYLTEIVQVFEQFDEVLAFSKYKDNFLQQAQDLKEALSEIFYFSDNHWRNVGVKNGKLICIDFDDFDDSEYKSMLPSEFCNR